MGGIFPHWRDVPDFKHKLWDHLAIMADFKLDIDYPFEIVKREELDMKPGKIAYPDKAIRYRHYGRFLESMIKKLSEMEEGEEKQALLQLLAVQMKKNLNNWNKEGIEDQKIVDDLREYSSGTIDLKVEDLRLSDQQRYNNNNNNNQRKQNNQNNQRKQNNQNNQRKKQQY
jgi:hypothetical protein